MNRTPQNLSAWQVLSRSHRRLQSHLESALKAEGLPPRYLPSRVITVEAVPLLGTGKVDYVSVTRMAVALTQESG